MKNKEEALEPLLAGRCRTPSDFLGCCQISLRRQGWLVIENFERSFPTWLDSDCLCVQRVTSTEVAAGLYAPQGAELVLERTGPIIRETWCEVHA